MRSLFDPDPADDGITITGPEHRFPKGVFGDAPVISSYTRARATEDGVLVDVTEWAREAGLVLPTCFTAALWEDVNAVPDSSLADARGRAHDVLWMVSQGAKRMREAGAPPSDRHTASLLMPVKGSRLKRYEVECVCGPGDAAEPVLTIFRHPKDPGR